MKSDVPRSGEGHEARSWMSDKHITDSSTAPRQQGKTLRGEAGLEKDLSEFGRYRGRVARRFHHNRIAHDKSRYGHAHQDGERKIPWRNDDAHSERQVDHLAALTR